MTSLQDSHPRVLVVGVYLADKPNYALAITDNLLAATQWHVDCKWASLGSSPVPDKLSPVTHINFTGNTEKSVIINRLLSIAAPITDYEFIIVVDDDIVLPPAFLDSFLEIVCRRHYALSQPSRSHSSYIDHFFVAQLHGIESRQTNFVEIGPLFCVHQTAFPVLFPLDEAAPMGWGLDFVWPKLLEGKDLMMGIVDKLCIEHSLRKPVSFYDHGDTDARMKQFFHARPHLTYEQSFHILESFMEDA